MKMRPWPPVAGTRNDAWPKFAKGRLGRTFMAEVGNSAVEEFKSRDGPRGGPGSFGGGRLRGRVDLYFMVSGNSGKHHSQEQGGGG